MPDEVSFTCRHCGKEYEDTDGDQKFALLTPPDSRSAFVVSLCSTPCLNALKVTGWRRSTALEVEELRRRVD